MLWNKQDIPFKRYGSIALIALAISLSGCANNRALESKDRAILNQNYLLNKNANTIQDMKDEIEDYKVRIENLRQAINEEQSYQNELRNRNNELEQYIERVERNFNLESGWELFFDEGYNAVIARQIEDGAFGEFNNTGPQQSFASRCERPVYDRSPEWPILGVTLSSDRRARGVRIESVHRGTDAWTKLKAGDVIISVADTPIEPGNVQKATKLVQAQLVMSGFAELYILRGDLKARYWVCAVKS